MSEVAHRQIEHTVLWNGGWDKYLIDLDYTTDAPVTALGPDWYKHHDNCTFQTAGDLWLLCRELNHSWYDDKVLPIDPEKGWGVHPDTKGVLILRHLGGGD